MSLIIVPAASLPNSPSGGASADGHSHNNLATLNKLSTSNGKLCFNGKVVGEEAIEVAYNLTLTATQVTQKYIALPDDCNISRAITLSLNGVSFPQGDFWEVKENVNSTTTDLISWDGLSLENIAQAGDSIFISYYKKI